jgi:hypothetical protein
MKLHQLLIGQEKGIDFQLHGLDSSDLLELTINNLEEVCEIQAIELFELAIDS